jgi:hypothetical protein
MQAAVAGRGDFSQARQGGLIDLVPLEAAGQIGSDVVAAVFVAGVLEDVAALLQVALQLQHAGLVLGELRLGVGDLTGDSLNLHLFLGDGVHVLANVGHQVFDHLARPLDLELDGHVVLDGILDPADRRADIAAGVSAEEQGSQEHGDPAPDDKLLNHRLIHPFPKPKRAAGLVHLLAWRFERHNGAAQRGKSPVWGNSWD